MLGMPIWEMLQFYALPETGAPEHFVICIFTQMTSRPLYVNEIVSALNRLSTITGNGSRAARQSILVSLLRRCDCSRPPAATADSSVESILGTRPELQFLVHYDL